MVSGRCLLVMRLEACLDGGHSLVTKGNIQNCIQVLSSLSTLNCVIWLIYSCYLVTVKPVLSGHPRDPRYCPLNRGVHLVQVHFTENKGRKIGLY